MQIIFSDSTVICTEDFHKLTYSISKLPLMEKNIAFSEQSSLLVL